MNPSNEWQIGYQKALINVISEAESMLKGEKKMIIESFHEGMCCQGFDPNRGIAEEYYNETFNARDNA